MTRGQKPTQVVERDGRQVEIGEVSSLPFTDTYAGPVRGVRVGERGTQRQRVGQPWQHEAKEQNWMWVMAGDWDGDDGAGIRDIGHWRRKIENHAFGQLTPHGHLTHCAHHHPVAVVALSWIKIIAFTLFHAVAILHGKPTRAPRHSERWFRSPRATARQFSSVSSRPSESASSGGLT